MTLPSDEQLMTAIQEGRLELLGILFERYHARAMGLCIRMARDPSLAEDLVQEAFVRVLRYRDSFSQPGSFGAWLYRIVRNVCLDRLTARDRESDAVARAEWTDPEEGETRHRWDSEEDERIEVVRVALSRLSEEERSALVLKRIHGLPYREIAERCDTSEGAMRVRVHRALQRLRTFVREIEIETGDDTHDM